MVKLKERSRDGMKRVKKLLNKIFIIFFSIIMGMDSEKYNYNDNGRIIIPSKEVISKLPPDGGELWNRLIFESSPYLLQHSANPDDWYPFNPVGSDGSMDGVTVTDFDWPYISWLDSHGVEGKSDVSQAKFVGKLPWRIEWPSKWNILDVSYEAFGKDHGAAGGTFDTAKEISRLLYEL